MRIIGGIETHGTYCQEVYLQSYFSLHFTSTCCCRNFQAGESKLKDNEQALLDSICKAYYLPKWCSINDYEKLFKANGLQGIKTADWSEEVAPFWGAVIKSALSAQGFMGLFKAGITTIKVGMAIYCVHHQTKSQLQACDCQGGCSSAAQG